MGALQILGAGAWLVYDHVTRPGVRGEALVVEVAPGMSGKDVGILLQDSGLLEHEGFFRLALHLKKNNLSIRHGAYELYHGLSAVELLALLEQGPTRHLLANQYRVTLKAF